MAGPTHTAVDLSRLPAPEVIETLDFEALLADAVADFRARMAAAGVPFDNRDSDPAAKLLQTFAYLVQLLRQRVNDAARAVMPAYATGANLDNIAAILGIARFTIAPADPERGTAAELESDADFRRRMVLAPEGFSVAGPEGAYLFHALSADVEVLDASATSPAPGEVVVAILARTGDGAAAPELVSRVQAYISADERRPLTDYVQVRSAEIVTYAVDYELVTYDGPDAAVVLAASHAKVATYVAESHRLGRDITRSALFAAAHVEGAQNVVLHAPAADIVVSRLQAPWCSAITSRLAGTNE